MHRILITRLSLERNENIYFELLLGKGAARQTKPRDGETFVGEIATYWLDNGILVSLSKSRKRTIENIAANVELVQKITNNKTVHLLIYLSDSPVPDKATRKCSAAHAMTKPNSALWLNSTMLNLTLFKSPICLFICVS